MPTFEYLAKATAGAGGSTSLTISNIPQVYDDLRIIAMTRSTTNSNNTYFRFNGSNESAAYVYQVSFNNNGSTTVPSTNGSATDITALGNQNAYDATTFAPTDYYIPGYRNWTEKTIYGLSSQAFYTTGVPAYQYITGSTWVATYGNSPINSITILSSGTALAQYSSITLYGIKRT